MRAVSRKNENGNISVNLGDTHTYAATRARSLIA